MHYEDVSAYVEGLIGEGNDLLAWVRKKSLKLRAHGVYPIDPSRARLLELFARMRSPRRVLEIGSGAGYGALWFMKGMGPDGTLDAIEYNPEVLKVLETVLKKAGLEGRVKIHRGPALTVLKEITGPYDFVFIDASKDEYPEYLEHALRLTRAGSMILADNMLWGGTTIHGDKGKDSARGIMEYTRRIFQDPRLSNLIVPLGDCLAVSYRVR